MPRGSPIITLRVPTEICQQIEREIEGSVHRRRAGAWTRSSWLLAAISEKISHARRSRRPHRSRQRGSVKEFPL